MVDVTSSVENGTIWGRNMYPASGYLYDRFVLQHGAGGNANRFSVGVGGNYKNMVHGIPADTWANVVVVYNPATGSYGGFECFVNGASIGTNTNTNAWTPAHPRRPITIGAENRSSPLYYFEGKLDEFAIWNRVFSDAEVATLSGSGGAPHAIDSTTLPGLSAYWRMGDGTEAGSGSTVYDMSSNSYTSTLCNGAAFSTDDPNDTPPSPSVTPSVTPSISVTPSVTPSITVSVTPSITVSPSVTPTASPSVTPSVTPSITVTPSTSPGVDHDSNIAALSGLYYWFDAGKINGVDATGNPSNNDQLGGTEWISRESKGYSLSAQHATNSQTLITYETSMSASNNKSGWNQTKSTGDGFRLKDSSGSNVTLNANCLFIVYGHNHTIPKTSGWSPDYMSFWGSGGDSAATQMTDDTSSIKKAGDSSKYYLVHNRSGWGTDWMHDMGDWPHEDTAKETRKNGWPNLGRSNNGPLIGMHGHGTGQMEGQFDCYGDAGSTDYQGSAASDTGTKVVAWEYFNTSNIPLEMIGNSDNYYTGAPGYYAEVIGLSAVPTLSERQTIRNYLSNKYNIYFKWDMVEESNLNHWIPADLNTSRSYVGDVVTGNTSTYRRSGAGLTTTDPFSATTGARRTAFSFDGTNDHWEWTGHTDWKLDPSYTISVRVRPEGIDTNWECPVAFSVVNNGGPGASIRFKSDTVRFTHYDTNTTYGLVDVTSPTLSDDTWYTLTQVYNTTTGLLSGFIDGAVGGVIAVDNNDAALGALVDPSSTGASITSQANYYLRVGMRASTAYFQGNLDDIRVYNKALTPDQIASIYNSGDSDMAWVIP